MIPNNSNSTNGCAETSSNCVIWQGPDLPGINLCNGDTISNVIFNLATELSNTTTTSPGVDIATINQACLVQRYGTANNIQVLISNIIDKLCECCESSGSTEDPCSCDIPLPACLQYKEEGTGNQITHLPLHDPSTNFGYAVYLANRICDNVSSIQLINNNLNALTIRVTNIENDCCHSHTGETGGGTHGAAKMVVPSFVGTPGIPQTIAKVLVETETAVGELRNAVGRPEAINAALNVAPALGGREVLSGKGTMASIPQFINNPVNLAQSVQNLWVTLNDTRNAVQSMKETVANPLCGDIKYVVAGSITRTAEGAFKNINLDFQESSIPTTYTDCNSKGTKITITDASLNSLVQYADVSGFYQNNGAWTLAATKMGNLDLGSNYAVRVEFCSSNGDNMCQEIQNFTLDNELVCPDILIGTVTADTIPFSVSGITIPANAGHTISALLRTNSGKVIDTRTYTAFSSGISGTFSNLDGATLYQVFLEVTRKGSSTPTQCAIQNVSTTAPVCAPVNMTSADTNWILSTTAETNLQSGANSIVLGSYNDGSGSLTRWTAGFDSSNQPILTQDTAVESITGWVHNGTFLNPELGIEPLYMTGLTASPMPPTGIGRTDEDSGWKYFGTLQDPTGNLFYVYASVNSTSHTINNIVFGCNCSGLYIAPSQPTYYCQKGGTVETTMDAIGYTQGSGGYTWTVSLQPSHGTVSIASGYPTTSQAKYIYSQDNTNMVGDSFTLSLVNECGAAVSTRCIPILPTSKIKYTSSDVIVFFDTTTITEAKALKIKTSLNNIRGGFTNSVKPNFYYVACIGSATTPSGDYLKHVRACVENIGTSSAPTSVVKAITIPSSGTWWTDIMQSGATLPAYWSGASATFPTDIKIISVTNNITSSGSGTYSTTATVPTTTSWTGFGPTSSSGSGTQQYEEDYDCIVDMMSGVTATSAWGADVVAKSDIPWIAGTIPFTFNQVIINILSDDALQTAASTLQMFAALQGDVLLDASEMCGSRLGLRRHSWSPTYSTGMNLNPYLNDAVASGATPYAPSVTTTAGNALKGLKDQMNSNISVHTYIENNVELDASLNPDIETYYKGMLALLPTGNAYEPITKGYGIIGGGANFGTAASAPVACNNSASAPIGKLYTAGADTTGGTSDPFSAIATSRAYLTPGGAVNNYGELTNGQYYAIAPGTHGSSYVAQYDVSGGSGKHWINITTCTP
jgi:hypothetical protein|tara:strand:+ start:1579 stop:5196 length:3618 start_codon:yes stop_codon:yes gene_type:complete